MKSLVLAVLMAAISVAPVMAQPAQSAQPRDTGSMAYPAPLPQGNVSTTVVTGPTTPDTGSAAFPAPLTQGNTGNTVSGQNATVR